jgi:hypothetical protein
MTAWSLERAQRLIELWQDDALPMSRIADQLNDEFPDQPKFPKSQGAQS